MKAALNARTLWRIGVPVALLIGGAVAAYAVYSALSSGDETELTENEQVIPVQYGDLINQVSVSGTLVYPDRETLTFGTPGYLGSLLVEEGQSVTEGQALAVLDPATIASLELAVAGARVSLRDADDALRRAQDPHAALDLARAEAAVANARLSVRDAQETLVTVLEPDARAIARAESVVAAARLALQTAEVELAGLLEPQTILEIAQAETAVTNAKIEVERVEELLASTTAGPDDQEVADAQLEIDEARTTLDNAHRDLELTQSDWANRLATAEEAYDDAIVAFNGAIDAYGAIFKDWLGIDLKEEEGLDPDTLLGNWNVDLDALFNPGTAPNPYYGIPPDDPGTRWDEATIFTRVFLYPGTTLPTCDDIEFPDGLPDGVRCVNKEFGDAWDLIQEPEDDTHTVELQRDRAVADAEKAVTRAEADLAQAQDTYNSLFQEAGTLEIEDLENQLAVAVSTLQQAEDDLARISDEPDPLEVAVKEKQVALAQADLEVAIEDLGDLTSGPDSMAVEAARHEIAIAEATFVQAEEQLEELRSSVDLLQVKLRESELASAQAALDEAIQRLSDSTLKASWDGVVSLVFAEAGKAVTRNTPVIELVDLTVIEMDGIVDEIDVLFIEIGAKATVTMDALSGKALQGAVSDVASVATSQQGVVSYPISIRLSAPNGVDLPEGLSATANVVIHQESDVLLVPIQSLYGSFKQPMVRVIAGDEIEERPVVVGNSDDFWVVVVEGLTEGEQVVLEAEPASLDDDKWGGLAAIKQIAVGSGKGGGGSK